MARLTRLLRRPLAAVLAVSLSSATALAQPPPQLPPETSPDARTRQAQARWDEGVAAANRGDYETARVAFEQAYAIKPVDAVLRNLAISQLRTGYTAEGARNLAKFLATDDGRAHPDRSLLEDLLTDTERKLGRIDIEVDVPDATVLVDNVRAGSTPLTHPWYVAPGPHEVQVSKPGHAPQARTVELGAGERVIERFALATVEPQPQPQPQPPPTTTITLPPPATATNRSSGGIEARTIALIATGGVFLVGATGATISLLNRSSAKGDIEDAEFRARRQFGSDACRGPAASGRAVCSALQSAIDDHQSATTAANTWLIVGGAGLAATAAVWFLWPKETDRAASLRVAPLGQPALGLGGVLVSGSF